MVKTECFVLVLESKALRQRWQDRHKFAYLTIKNSTIARFPRAIIIFLHFAAVLVLCTTWNDLFCSFVDDVTTILQIFNFFLLPPDRWYQFNYRILRTHFPSIITRNNREMVTEWYEVTFRSRYHWRRACWSPAFVAAGPLRIFGSIITCSNFFEQDIKTKMLQ